MYILFISNENHFFKDNIQFITEILKFRILSLFLMCTEIFEYVYLLL